MKLTIVCMGKTRERFIQDGIAKYLRYLKPYAATEIKELREEKVHDLKDAPLIREKEAGKIFKAVSPQALLVALDERGQEFTSHGFAEFLNKPFSCLSHADNGQFHEDVLCRVLDPTVSGIRGASPQSFSRQ